MLGNILTKSLSPKLSVSKFNSFYNKIKLITIQDLRLWFRFFKFDSDRQKYLCYIWFEGGFGIVRCGHFWHYRKKEFVCTECKAIFKLLFSTFFGGFWCLFVSNSNQRYVNLLAKLAIINNLQRNKIYI